MTRLYSPPPGFYDLPFMWVFDASTLTNGQNALNQQIPIYAGYGDFILRRIVGLDRVLNNSAAVPGQVNPPGQFQIRDAIGRYLQEVPQYVGTGGPGATQNSRDIAIVPEILYPENSQIGFDLWDVNLATDDSGSTHNSAQIGFHGVRRIRGSSPLAPKYKYRPKHFVYTLSQLVTAATGVNGLVKLIQPVQDFDFELHQLAITYSRPATQLQAGGMYIAAVAAGAAGNGATLAISALVPANQALSIAVAGPTVTVLLATDSLGNIITTQQQLVSALNANLAVQAVFVAGAVSPGALVTPATLVAAGGGAPISPNSAIALFLLYDFNRVQCQSIATTDIFLNRLSYDQNGALVPPLWYPQQSLIELDCTTLQKSGAFRINVAFMGVRRIPC